MSVIYQNELLELTPQDLQVLEQELNQEDDYQQLDLVTENWMDELEARWESDYSPRPLTEQEEEEWLQYEQERLESAILESEENYL
jgi:hypothetical protein